MIHEIESIDDFSESIDPLQREMNEKIRFVSRIVLIIAIGGFSTYALFEFLWGVHEVFLTGLITSVTLFFPLVLVFLNKVKAGIILFLIVMTGSMMATQFFYIHNSEFLGLMMVDFSVYFGLIITSGFILYDKRYIFIIVLITALANGLCVAYLASGITLETKRFFLIELFVFMAIGVLLYYFTSLYNRFINKARLEMEKQRISKESLIQVNRVFGRFVPNNFLRLLNKKDITHVQLGDQIQMNMTVMFTDIRSFTSLSEKMSPKENFEFLNSLLKFVGPTIRHFQGFIDKYIGDAVLALFPVSGEHAIKAAIEIQKLLSLFNLERERNNKAMVKMGFGIHTGDVIAGIIGEEERMEETVISDTVNLASRLESLTKVYGADILVSGDTLDTMRNKDKLHYRFLDTLQAEGKIMPVSIYEILDYDNPEHKKRFDTWKVYTTGWELYCDGRINDAIEKFKYILSHNPSDTAAKYQLRRCQEFVHE